MKIIGILSREPATFKQLIEKSKLSRSRVNAHLKKLEEEGAIKKEYQDGKILNVLVQTSEFDFVGFFIDDLENFGVPIETAEKTRSFLNLEVLIAAQSMYRNMLILLVAMNNQLSVKTNKDRAEIEHDLGKYSLLCDLIPKSVPALQFEPENKSWASYTFEMNPYVFHLALIQYNIEKARNNGKVKDEKFDKCKDWWFNEVCPYLPLSGFLNIVLESINKYLPWRILEIEP